MNKEHYNTLSPYDQWVAKVIYAVAGILEIRYAEAQGIVEAKEFEVSQAWAKGISDEETATEILKD